MSRATVCEDLTGAGAAASKLLARSLHLSPHGPPYRAVYDKIPPRAGDPRDSKKAKAQIEAAVSFVS